VHSAMKELPLVDDYGDGFSSRMVEWGEMVLEFSPKKEYQMTIDIFNKNIAAAQTT
jgi:hypothetical protein